MRYKTRFAIVTLTGSILCAAPVVGATFFVSYVDRMPDGTTIDWSSGLVKTVGTSRIVNDIEKGKGFYTQTRKLAEMDARARLLAALGEVPVEGKTRLKEETAALAEIKDLLAPIRASSVESNRGPMFMASMSTSLWGDDGIISLVMPGGTKPNGAAATESTTSGEGTSTSAPPSVARAEADHSTPADVSGLILDATALPGVNPALLPKVLDEAGRLVYGLGPADDDFVRGRGLIAYSEVLQGNEEQRRPYEREGNKPLRVTVKSLAGPLQTDLVISVADADRILAAAASSKFLTECRVIALLPPPPIRRNPVAPPSPGSGAHPTRPNP